ncbi:delta-12 fatty acid desaturase [Amanita rubescens]|nr:delta-12 fatty acid desaturase [Amanita rubescens]
MLSSISLFRDSPEYQRRLTKPFKPTNVTLAEIRAVVPQHLFQKSTLKGLYYAARDLLCVIAFYEFGVRIDPFSAWFAHKVKVHTVAIAVKWTLWALYWYWQGVAFAACWCLSHEAGHGNLSPHAWINHTIGFTFHTAVLAPYFAWRSSHRAHHQATMSIERDENYVPRTRSNYKLPPANIAEFRDYHEILEETPLYTLVRMMIMQLLGWQIYLFMDTMGSPRHPRGTNHFSPYSSLFKPEERYGIIASDMGLIAMSFVLYTWATKIGLAKFVMLYGVPYILTHHWIVMLTYLHHSDPSIPHYRRKEWSFLRGALSTVDRPLLGWIGRFFFHNVSHDHISHHLFSTIPFYNQPQVTEAIKKVLKEDYNYDSTNSFRALHRSFTQCLFIEDEGDIIFYRNKYGQQARSLAEETMKNE